jgi:hypothetical protein
MPVTAGAEAAATHNSTAVGDTREDGEGVHEDQELTTRSSMRSMGPEEGRWWRNLVAELWLSAEKRRRPAAIPATSGRFCQRGGRGRLGGAQGVLGGGRGGAEWWLYPVAMAAVAVRARKREPGSEEERGRKGGTWHRCVSPGQLLSVQSGKQEVSMARPCVGHAGA